MMKSSSPEWWPQMGALTTCESSQHTSRMRRPERAPPWLVNLSTLVSSISYCLPGLDRHRSVQAIGLKGTGPVGPFHPLFLRSLFKRHKHERPARPQCPQTSGPPPHTAGDMAGDKREPRGSPESRHTGKHGPLPLSCQQTQALLMAWSWCSFFRGRFTGSRGLAQTRLLIERNESTAETGEPRKLQSLKLLLPRASEDVTCLYSCSIPRGWTGYPASSQRLPRATTGPRPRPLLTWSCLRSFLCLLRLPVFHKPKSHGQQHSWKETELGVAPGRRVGRKTKKLGGPSSRFCGPLTSPQL